MSESKSLNSSGLALISHYSDSEDETDPVEVFSSVDVITRILINDVLTKVVTTAKSDFMVIDTNPTFDVYRPRKRELSESSSVLVSMI
jgi:hypothetical protein